MHLRTHKNNFYVRGTQGYYTYYEENISEGGTLAVPISKVLFIPRQDCCPERNNLVSIYERREGGLERERERGTKKEKVLLYNSLTTSHH